VLRACRRRRRPADGRARPHARRRLDGFRVHGRAHLCGQRAEFHDLRDRDRARRQDAELFRLPRMVVRGAGAGVRARHLRFFRAVLALRLAPRALAAFAFAGGSTAIASTSNKAPGRASWEIATVVLAGAASVLTNWSRTSRKVPICDMSVRELLIFTTFFMSGPIPASAALRFSNALVAWARKSPGPATSLLSRSSPSWPAM